MAESYPNLRRRDGRNHQDLRQISINFPSLARVDGSAFFSFGATSAITSTGTFPPPHQTTGNMKSTTSAVASVTGPAEVRLASEHPSHLTFEVFLRPFCGVPATESKALAADVRHVLGTSLIWNANPRTLVQVIVQVLGSSWGAERKKGARDAVMATAMNAGMLALMNAGSVPLKGVVCAVAIGRRLVDSMLVLDPDKEEEADLSESGCFAFLFSSSDGAEGVVGKCVWTNWRATGKGSFSERALSDARELGRGAAGDVYVAIKKEIEVVQQRSEFWEPALRKGTGKGVIQPVDHENQPDSADDHDDEMEI